MLNEEKEIGVTVIDAAPKESDGALDIIDDANLFAVAETAEKRVAALTTIMSAALKITSNLDWVIIGGVPYLQESGVTKVARLFGVSWDIVNGFPTIETDNEGHKTFTYRMKFSMGNSSVVVEGSRSSRDPFFSKDKSLDQIDMRDVKISAQTNCLNNGIKKLIPGLRNIDIAVLEKNGFNLEDMKGYTFKEGSKGGAKANDAKASGLVCECCGKAVTQKSASYSQSKYNGHIFCYDCDHSGKATNFLQNGVVSKPETPVPAQAPKPAPAPAQAPEDEVPPFDDLPY